MFLQLKSEDEYYYTLVNEGRIDDLKRIIGNPGWISPVNKIIYPSSLAEVRKGLYEPGTAFIAPDSLFKHNMLIEKELPFLAKDGIRTTQQEKYDENIDNELYNKFGMVVAYPVVKFKDLSGFKATKKDFLKAKEFAKAKLIKKVLGMLLGVSRSGKSFFAECLAGELGYKLIILDLGVIMCSDNPPQMLDAFLRRLSQLDNYVLLIDEIEKVVNPEIPAAMATVMLGKLLTTFNNFNTPLGFDIKDNVIIATANNIDGLRKKNPEFINRFSLKYFFNYPQKDDFIYTCDYYTNKLQIHGITGEDIFNISSQIYARNEVPLYNQDTAHFIKRGKYASGEVEEFITNLALRCDVKKNMLYCDTTILRQVLIEQKPQLVSSKDGVNTTINAAKKANFIEAS